MRLPFFGPKVTYTEKQEVKTNFNTSIVSSAKSVLYPDSTYEPYNPDKLYQKRGNYDLIDKMRGDDQIKPILEFKKSIVLGSGYFVDSEEEEVKEFWDYALNEYFEGQFNHALYEVLSGIEYGFSLSEIIYGSDVVEEMGNKPYWMVKNLKARPPHSFELYTDDFGKLIRIKQWRKSGQPVDLPADKFIHYVHLGEFSNPYGTSDLTVAVYRSWFSKDAIIRFWNIALERFSVPPAHGKYPPNSGSTTKDDLLKVLKNLQSKDAIATASDIEIELLRAEPQAQVFKEAIDTHDLRIARSMLMPDLLGLSGAQATSSGLGDKLGSVQFDIFMEVMKKIRINLVALINRQIIKPLTNANFGNDVWAELKFRELTKQSEQDALRLFIDFIQRGGAKLTGEQQIWGADIIGAPTAELEELQEAGELDVKPAPVMIPGVNPNDPNAQPAKPGIPKPEGKPNDNDKPPKPEEKPESGKPPEPEEKEHSFQYAAGKFSRSLLNVEKKVNFSEIDRRLDEINETHAVNLGKVIKTMLGDMKDAILRRRIIERKNYDAVNQLTLKGMPALRSAFTAMLKDAYETGMVTAEGVNKQFAIFPTEGKAYEEVAQWLKNRTVYLADEEAEALLKIAKGVLMDGIRTGAGVKDIISMLEDEYTAWDMDDAVGGSRIETIVRTNTAAAFNESRGQQFAKLGDAIIGYEYSAVMDNRTSDICMALDKKFITPAEYDAFCPPNHYNCRSILVPIFHDETEEAEKLEEPPAVKREKGGFLTLKN